MTDPLLAVAPALDAVAVLAYLRQHPEFLDDHPELAAPLNGSRDNGAVASLASYQLKQLREKNADLERQLAELGGIAAENQRLMERVHALCVALLGADSVEAVARIVAARLGEDFRIEQHRLIVFGPTRPTEPGLETLPGPHALPEFAEFLGQDEPLSGRLSPERMQRLFGAQADAVRSVALLRLGNSGLLALGSTNADHFQPGMGTVFLKMIAATIVTALAHARLTHARNRP